MNEIYLNRMGLDVTEEVATLRKKLEVAEEYIHNLRNRAERAEDECQEQARLLGISANREAALLAKIQDQALSYLALEKQAWELMDKFKSLDTEIKNFYGDEK